MVESGLIVREMQPSEAYIRMDYFHDSTDDHLRMLGVDRELLPSKEHAQASYEADFVLPVERRQNYSLVWELDHEVVGFSTTHGIVFGQEAFMHLHLLNAAERGRGMGTALVKRSAYAYFDVLKLNRLFSEPNAFNVAPNRALQGAGFRYLCTYEAAPTPINPPQPVTRWVLDRSTIPSLR